MAVGLAHVTADRIDDDQRHVPDLADFLLKQGKVGLQVKRAAALAVLQEHGAHDVDAFPIGAGRDQARDNRVVRAVLGVENYDVAQRRAALTAWPLATPGNRGGYIDGKLALAIAGLARKGGVLAACKSPRPQKINAPRRDVCRPPRTQIGGLRKPRSLIIGR